MEKAGYSERIKEVRTHFGMNKTAFASHTNILRSALSEFESGKREPTREFIETLSNMGISIDWFLSGTGAMLKPKNRLDNEAFVLASKYPPKSQKIGLLSEGLQKEAKELASPTLPAPSGEGAVETTGKESLVVVDGGIEQGVLIPVIGQSASAGFGFDYEEGEIIRYVKIPAWIARRGRDIVAMPIYGESMEPTLSRGDLAVCDSGGFKDDGIYVLRDNERGLMFCKRVIWTPGGWTIVSDNPRYEPMKVDDRAIEIVARVIAAVKEVK